MNAMNSTRDCSTIEPKLYRFSVAGKDYPSAGVADLLADLGLEVSTPSAPPEFWRALLGPVEPRCGFDPGSPAETEEEFSRRVASKRDLHERTQRLATPTGDASLDEIFASDPIPEWDPSRLVRFPSVAPHWFFGGPSEVSQILEAVLQLDLGRFEETDREILVLCFEAIRNHRDGDFRYLVSTPYAVERVKRAYRPSVAECKVEIFEDQIRLGPIPLAGAGRVRISREKLEKIKPDLKSENPRLARIQSATLLASVADLLAEARRGAKDPKSDGDGGGGDKIQIRCPTASHEDKRPAAYVEMYPDGIGWGCSACPGGASSLPGLIRAYHPRASWEEAYTRAECILGLPEWGRIEPEQIVTDGGFGEISALVELASSGPAPTGEPAPEAAQKALGEAAPAPQAEPAPAAPPSPPVAPGPDLGAWYRSLPPTGGLAEAWAASRGLGLTATKTFLRGCPATAPSWNGGELDERFLDLWASQAGSRGYSLLLPTVNHEGRIVGVRARGCTEGASKARSPSVKAGGKTYTLPQAGVLANPVGARAIRDGKWPDWIVLTEGEPDFLTACQAYPGQAVLGVYKGKSVWTQSVADRIPDGVRVALLVDTDRAGKGYRREIIRSIGKRVRFFDFPGRKSDLNALHQAGKVPALDELEQIPVGQARDLTDLGNAERLLDEHGGELAYQAELARWFVLTDGVWVQQPREPLLVRERVQKIAKRIESEAETAATEDGAKATFVWAKKSQESGRISAAITEAKTIFSVGDVFDKNPFLLGVENGVLDLSTGELLEDPGPAYVSRRCGVEFAPEATAPRWEKFLAEIMLGDPELVEYLRRCVGYWLTGSCREQKFWLLHGARGQNGKGTFLNAIQKLLGPASGAFGPDLICRREGQAKWDLGRLEGLRLVYVNEAPPSGALSVETVKNIVSEDKISGENKHQAPRDFSPSHKVVWALNDLPEIPSDPALFRRVRLIPFDFHAEVPDDNLATTLEAELPGILAWAAQGAREWLEGGLRCPEKVLARVRDLEAEADSVGEWIRTACELGAEFCEGRKALHENFAEWARREGKAGLSNRVFFADLEKKGLSQGVAGGRKSRIRSFLGIRIRPDLDPDSPFSRSGSESRSGLPEISPADLEDLLH
jgi:P4 family phage/plasmid primase-like protien